MVSKRGEDGCKSGGVIWLRYCRFDKTECKSVGLWARVKGYGERIGGSDQLWLSLFLLLLLLYVMLAVIFTVIIVMLAVNRINTTCS